MLYNYTIAGTSVYINYLLYIGPPFEPTFVEFTPSMYRSECSIRLVTQQSLHALNRLDFDEIDILFDHQEETPDTEWKLFGSNPCYQQLVFLHSINIHYTVTIMQVSIINIMVTCICSIL